MVFPWYITVSLLSGLKLMNRNVVSAYASKEGFRNVPRIITRHELHHGVLMKTSDFIFLGDGTLNASFGFSQVRLLKAASVVLSRNAFSNCVLKSSKLEFRQAFSTVNTSMGSSLLRSRNPAARIF